MKTPRWHSLGWVIASAALGLMAAAGFQTATDKVGVVDLSKVVEASKFGQANQAQFATMKKTREDVLAFIDTNRVLTTDQAQRIRDLSLKDSLTAAEQSELDRLKADVVAAAKKNTELSTKATLTPEERTLMEDYARRGQAMDQLEQTWYRDFTNEMQDWADKRKMASVDKARAAVGQVAKAQGYSVVFEAGVAPYGANDLSDDTLKAMDAAK